MASAKPAWPVPAYVASLEAPKAVPLPRHRSDALESLASMVARYREHNDSVARRIPALDGLLDRCKATLARQLANAERDTKARLERTCEPVITEWLEKEGKQSGDR